MTLVETNNRTPQDRRGPFDYSQLPANLASEARWRAKRINVSKEKHILEVGLELITMKEKLAHGQFTDWIDRELNFSPATGRNYMAASRAFADKPLTVSVLPPATLYRLASANPEIRAAIVSRVEAGEYVDRDEVEDAIRRPKATAVDGNRDAAAQRRRERPDEAMRRAAAARELIDCLSKHFTKEEILKMHAIWREAGSDALQAAFDGLPSTSPRMETPDGQ